MNTDIVSIDTITIEDILEEPATPLIIETGSAESETVLPLSRRFGIVDLWKIRSKKRHFTFYR